MTNLHAHYLSALQQFLQDNSFQWELPQLRSWWPIMAIQTCQLKRYALLGDGALRQVLERLVTRICHNVPQHDRHAMREALLSNEAFRYLMRYNGVLLGHHNYDGHGKCYGDLFEAAVGYADEAYGPEYVYVWAERTFTPLVQALSKAYCTMPTGQKMSRKAKQEKRAERVSSSSKNLPICAKHKSRPPLIVPTPPVPGSPLSDPPPFTFTCPIPTPVLTYNTVLISQRKRSLLDRLDPVSSPGRRHTPPVVLTPADKAPTVPPIQSPSWVPFVAPPHHLHLRARLGFTFPHIATVEVQTPFGTSEGWQTPDSASSFTSNSATSGTGSTTT